MCCLNRITLCPSWLHNTVKLPGGAWLSIIIQIRILILCERPELQWEMYLIHSAITFISKKSFKEFLVANSAVFEIPVFFVVFQEECLQYRQILCGLWCRCVSRRFWRTSGLSTGGRKVPFSWHCKQWKRMRNIPGFIHWCIQIHGLVSVLGRKRICVIKDENYDTTLFVCFIWSAQVFMEYKRNLWSSKKLHYFPKNAVRQQSGITFYQLSFFSSPKCTLANI